MQKNQQKERVAVVYHYFQHYRKGIFSALLSSKSFEYEFYADEKNFYQSGVEPWKRPKHAKFTKAKCLALPFKWMWQSKLTRLALRRDVNAIIFFGNAYYLATWLSAILGRFLGKRVLFWTQGWTKRLTGIKALVRRTFYHRADALLVYGHFAKQMAIEQGFAPEKVHVVYNSLDYSAHLRLRTKYEGIDLNPLRSKLFEHPEYPIVICCTRMIQRRRLDWLILAAAQLRDAGHPINLLLVGDGPELANLENLSREQNIDAHFFGPCYEEETLCQLYRISAVTAAPGMIGLTAMHSLGFGVPIVTHGQWDAQMPEWEAVIPGKTGGLFENHNVKDLARLLQEWTQSLQPSEATRQECIAIIERFFSPTAQKRIIERALQGLPANDLHYLEN